MAMMCRFIEHPDSSGHPDDNIACSVCSAPVRTHDGPDATDYDQSCIGFLKGQHDTLRELVKDMTRWVGQPSRAPTDTLAMHDILARARDILGEEGKEKTDA